MKLKLLFILFTFPALKLSFSQSTLPSFECTKLGGYGTGLFDNGVQCQRAPVFLPEFPSCDVGEYNLVFDEEFDSTALDTTKWHLQSFAQGTIAGDPNQNFDTLGNVVVSGGICSIIGKHETVVNKKVVNYEPGTQIQADGLPNYPRTYNYTSASLWTSNTNLLFYHGKYEIRFRISNGIGFWPSFWLLGGGANYNELDIFDNEQGNENFDCGPWHRYYATGKSEGCRSCFSTSKYGINIDLSQWHTINCIWDFDKITWLIDGKLIRILYRVIDINGNPINCGDNIGVGTYFNQEAFPIQNTQMIISLAIGTGTNAPDANTVFPGSFDIDYIRYWKQSDCCHDLPLPTPLEISFSVYPNPTEGKISVVFNNSGILMPQSGVYFNLYSVTGALVYRKQLTDINTDINLASVGLNNGFYVYNIVFEDGPVKVGKLILIKL